MPRALITLVALSFATPAFAVDGWGAFADGGKVYRVHLGESPEQLYSGSVAHAVWSATGVYIYFIKTDGSIWRMANDGSGAAEIASGNSTNYNPLAAYRPDDEFVLYVQADKLYRVDGSSGQMTLLEDSSRNYVGEIAISQDGNRMAARGSDSNLYRITAGSGSQQYATTCSASLSPDGSMLTANVDGHKTLTIHRWDGSVLKTLNAPSGHEWDNQKFAVNSNDYVVYKLDTASAIGVVRVSTDTTTRLADLYSEYPDFLVGDLPSSGTPPPPPPANSAPTITGLDASPNTAQVDQAIELTCTATDADGDSLTYAWDLGDGSTATGAQVSHAYAGAGTFDITVTVSDGQGHEVSAAAEVVVLDGQTQVIVLEAEEMQLAGYDIEGDVIATMDTGTATDNFPGTAGAYRLEVTIIKEDDGEPYVDVLVNGTAIDRITYPLGSGSRDPEVVDLGVHDLAAGDVITLEGVRVDGAAARLDRVTFSNGDVTDPPDPPHPPDPPEQPDLPEGYFVWSRGDLHDSTSRRIYRMTLPEKTDVIPLTSGEDIGGQVSPDGRWVAYAKARLPGGTDYHDFGMWSVYIVSIDGVDNGGVEIEIDEEGYWPSWGGIDELYYSKADGRHTQIMRVTIDSDGNLTSSETWLATSELFGDIPEINECFVAPDGSWFAGRTRGNSEPGVGAYNIDPAEFHRLGWTGGSGCMPYVAPSGTWGFHAGSSNGVRWGDAPWVPDRQVNQQLVAAKSGGACYHPGISTDEKWFMTGHSQDSRQNDGAWDIYIYALDGKTATDEKLLVSGGFNGWPHIYVFEGTLPPDDPQDPQDPPDDPQDPPGDPQDPSGDLRDAAPDDVGVVGSCRAVGVDWLAVLAALVLVVRRRNR